MTVQRDPTAPRQRRPRHGRPAAFASRRARATRTSKASSSATAVRVAYEVYGAGRADRSCSCRPWHVVHSRHWKAQIPYFARRHRVIALTTAGTAGPTGRAIRWSTSRASGRGPHRGHGRAGVDGGRARGPVSLLRPDDGPRRPSIRSACSGCLHLSGVAVRRTVVTRDAASFEEPLTGRRRLGQVEHPLLAPRLRCLPRVLLPRGFTGAALHKTGRRLRRLGDRRPTLETLGCHGPHATDARRPDVHRDVCRDPRPDAGHPGHHERIAHVSQGIGLAAAIPGARLELIDGGGHLVHARDPVRVPTS